MKWINIIQLSELRVFLVNKNLKLCVTQTFNLQTKIIEAVIFILNYVKTVKNLRNEKVIEKRKRGVDNKYLFAYLLLTYSWNSAMYLFNFSAAA